MSCKHCKQNLEPCTCSTVADLTSKLANNDLSLRTIQNDITSYLKIINSLHATLRSKDDEILSLQKRTKGDDVKRAKNECTHSCNGISGTPHVKVEELKDYTCKCDTVADLICTMATKDLALEAGHKTIASLHTVIDIKDDVINTLQKKIKDYSNPEVTFLKSGLAEVTKSLEDAKLEIISLTERNKNQFDMLVKADKEINVLQRTLKDVVRTARVALGLEK